MPVRILIVLPTYNEVDNLRLLLPALLALPETVEICVVDDASPDGTGALADEAARRDRRVQVIHRSGKLGLGTAYVAGFAQALAGGFDGALTMDADFSHHPRYIPDLLARFAQADLIIGSRFVPGGEVRYPFHRRMLSRVANGVARGLLGFEAHDCTAGFRLYHARVLRAIPLDQIRSNGYSFLTEMLWHIHRRGFRTAETPIIFEDRVRGQSKISSAEIFKGAYTVFRLAVSRP
jgi:dolichol-phosphate mannosyltransferase